MYFSLILTLIYWIYGPYLPPSWHKNHHNVHWSFCTARNSDMHLPPASPVLLIWQFYWSSLFIPSLFFYKDYIILFKQRAISSTEKIKGFRSCCIYFRYCGLFSLACSFVYFVLSYLRILGITTSGDIRENYFRILPK